MPEVSYTPTTAAGRRQITNLLRSLVESYYPEASVDVTEQWPAAPSREALVEIRLNGARVGIGIGPDDVKHGYCLPWCIDHDSEKTFSAAFARATGSDVNHFHRRKCTAFAGPSSGHLLQKVDDALRCIASGEAFE